MATLKFRDRLHLFVEDSIYFLALLLQIASEKLKERASRGHAEDLGLDPVLLHDRVHPVCADVGDRARARARPRRDRDRAPGPGRDR